MYTICVLVLLFTHESTYLKIKKYKALNYFYERLPQIIIFFLKKQTNFIDTSKEKTLYQDCPNGG